jgi:CBS domain-containing protein
MATVSVILSEKGTKVWSVAPSDTVFAALELMAEKDIGALLVLDGTRITGIFSERDYARKVILMGKASKSTPVSEIMTREVLVVSPDSSLEECMGVMTGKKVRHLPVLDGDEIVGMISIGDVVNQLLNQKEFVIEQLESYIKGY